MMGAHRASWYLATVLVAAAAGGATAQTSTATVEPGPDGSTPAPVSPLAIADIDFPLEAMLANEQGKVTLRFVTDGAGRATSIQLVSSSGVTRLDQQAGQIARTRWQFPPNTTVQVAVDWKLPLEPVAEFRVALPAAAEGTTPPKSTNSHRIVENDYPAPSIRAGERGRVVLHYAVQEDGTVRDVQLAATSGYPRLDEAAALLVKRWTFEPARLAETAVKFWFRVSVDFQLVGVPSRGEQPSCFDRPYISDGANITDERVLITASLVSGPTSPSVPPQNGPTMDRWAYSAADGRVTDVLIGTSRGVMRMSKPLVEYMAQSVRYPRRGNANGCWYFEKVPMSR
jgi:TonB family protein